MQSSQKCPMCGAVMAAGVLVCPNCGEDLTKASMIASTTIQPLSKSVRRKVVGRGSKALYVILAAIVVVTAFVGLAYVPSVSARVPQLVTLSSAVEDIVGQAVQWGREMMGAPPVTPPRVPAKKTPAPAVTNPPAPQQPVAQQNGPSAQKPPAKPAPVKPPQPAKKPAKPAAKARPARQAQKAAPAGPSWTTPLLAGTRAPQFVLKDIRGVLFRMPDYQGRRIALLLVWALDADGRAAIHQFLNRFANHPGYDAVVVVIDAQAERIEVRRIVAAGVQVPVLFGNEEIASAYRVPRNGGVLYVISERGVIAQARLVRGKQQ